MWGGTFPEGPDTKKEAPPSLFVFKGWVRKFHQKLSFVHHNTALHFARLQAYWNEFLF
jgi:hypothetical protein